MLLVSSSGGVLLDLLALAPWWSRHDATWAVVRATDTESALTGENVQWINECHAAQPLRLLRGLGAARRLIRRVDPDVIISAGSGAAVPFFLAGRALGVPLLWISTLNVTQTRGLADRLCAPLARCVLVQHSELVGGRTNAIMVGELY